MELNSNEIVLKLSNLISVSSFIKGTLIFTLFTISDKNNESIVMIGLYFVGIAFVVNLILFLTTLGMIFFTKSKEYRTKFWIAIAFQLANIPIAIAYFYFVINDKGIL